MLTQNLRSQSSALTAPDILLSLLKKARTCTRHALRRGDRVPHCPPACELCVQDCAHRHLVRKVNTPHFEHYLNLTNGLRPSVGPCFDIM